MSPLWSKGPSWPSAAHCIYTAHLIFPEQSEATYSAFFQRSVSVRLFFINNTSVCVKGCSCIYICMSMCTCVWVHVYIYAYTCGSPDYIQDVIPPLVLSTSFSWQALLLNLELPNSVRLAGQQAPGILLSLSQHWEYGASSNFLYGWWASKLRLSCFYHKYFINRTFFLAPKMFLLRPF